VPNAYQSTSVLSNLVKTGYDRKFRLALRSLPQFRSIADVKPANETNPGDSVAFHIYSDLAPVTTTLDEITDPDSVAVANPAPISVTLEERGNYSVTTRRLRAFTLDPKTDGNLANILAFNMVDSLDAVVRGKLDAGTQVIRESAGALSTTAAVTTVTPTDVHKARDYRYAITKLRAANVLPMRGDKYGVFIHPEAALDLRTETGAAAWRTPQEYQAVEALKAGEIGTWEGGIFMETPRATNAQSGSGAGGTQTRVFNSYVLGQEALAEAVAEEPHLVLDGVVVDPLKRKVAAGWYGIIGWNLFRPESLWVIQGASSIHPNA
jgi:N4-gp56 family major capsid protein